MESHSNLSHTPDIARPPAEWPTASPGLVSRPPSPTGPPAATPGTILAPIPQSWPSQQSNPEQPLLAPPSDPVLPANVAEEGGLPFSVVDVPGDPPSGPGLVHLPPLPEQARDQDSGVRRLPPVPSGLSAMGDSSPPMP